VLCPEAAADLRIWFVLFQGRKQMSRHGQECQCQICSEAIGDPLDYPMVVEPPPISREDIHQLVIELGTGVQKCYLSNSAIGKIDEQLLPNSFLLEEKDREWLLDVLRNLAFDAKRLARLLED
jgi:hypothetical protein